MSDFKQKIFDTRKTISVSILENNESAEMLIFNNTDFSPICLVKVINNLITVKNFLKKEQ